MMPSRAQKKQKQISWKELIFIPGLKDFPKEKEIFLNQFTVKQQYNETNTSHKTTRKESTMSKSQQERQENQNCKDIRY